MAIMWSNNSVDPTNIERAGRKEKGIVAEVGVRRAWRMRGLAAAPLAHGQRALREADMDYALLGVDAALPMASAFASASASTNYEGM